MMVFSLLFNVLEMTAHLSECQKGVFGALEHWIFFFVKPRTRSLSLLGPQKKKKDAATGQNKKK